jgi:hypothetical protein
MKDGEKNLFSGPVTLFHERRLPVPGVLAGYSALTEDEARRVEEIYADVFNVDEDAP